MKAVMSARLLPVLLILFGMIAAPILVETIRPTRKAADEGPRVDLEAMIPKQFGEWRTTPLGNLVIADPRTQEKLAQIYSQVLTRTYMNSRGKQVMLSIAYGVDQRDSANLLHYPEVCYPSQGFESLSSSRTQLATLFGNIKVKRLEMVLGDRHEPVTYWTMMGEHQSLGGVDKKLIEARYALKGVIPDGLLFRVSSIDRDPLAAYMDHDNFVISLVSAFTPEARKRLTGL